MSTSKKLIDQSVLADRSFSKLSALFSSILLLSVCLPLKASAYPMSGIDSSLTLNAGVAPLSLVTKKKATVMFPAGIYRLRLSNSSKSLHIMTDKVDNEFKISGGFPRGDLRNFDIAGDKFGNKVDLHGTTNDIETGTRSYQSDESCSWTCGYDRLCQVVPRQVCGTDPKTHTQSCVTVSAQECRIQALSCYGRSLFAVTDVSFSRVFEMKLNASDTKAELGKFQGVVSSWTNNISKALLQTSCGYDLPRPYFDPSYIAVDHFDPRR